MAPLEKVLEEALALPEDQRSELVSQLLMSLEPDDGDTVSGEEWQRAWSAEIERRVQQLRDGSVELVDGDEVLATARSWLESRRP